MWLGRAWRQRADVKKRDMRIRAAGCNDRATKPVAPLPRAIDGCVDFGVGLRCSLGRDRTGSRRYASRLGQRQNPQQRGPFQYFKRLPVLALLLATIALANFVLEKSNRGLRGLNASEGCAFHRRYPRYQRFNNSSNFCEMSVFKSLRK